MKKVLLVAVAGLFVLASCKKDRQCECTTTYADGSTQVDTDLTTYKKVTKRLMKTNLDCVDIETVDSDGDTYKQECEIK